MSKSPSLLTKAAACALFAPSLAAFAAVPSVTSVIDMDNEAQVANRATPVIIVSWDATDLTAANTANYKLRRSHENPSIQAVYRDYLGAPLSERA